MEHFGDGGWADVLAFRNYVPGETYVTADLTGWASGQMKNSLGQYELVICMKSESIAAVDMISRLARYTCDARIEPLHTLDIRDFLGDKTLRALLFANLQEPPPFFKVSGTPCGLLLCIGITSEELEFADEYGPEELLELLKKNKIFPYTIPNRPSVPF